MTRPDDYRVFLQQGGIYRVQSLRVPEDFEFPEHDLALLRLDSPVVGIPGLALADDKPVPGTPASIVGFGNTGQSGDQGIKRRGAIMTAACDPLLSATDFICWNTPAGGTTANTCAGDSGGALFLSQGSPLLGIASGGFGNCQGPDRSFNTAVSTYTDTIGALSEGAVTDFTLGEQMADTYHRSGQDHAMVLSVAEGASRLVVTANALEGGNERYALYVRYDDPPDAQTYDCRSTRVGVYQACEIKNPAAGDWYVSYENLPGKAAFMQLSATAFRRVCSLDVDGDGKAWGLTDGLLMVRYLGGVNDLVIGAVAEPALRRSSQAIRHFLETPACSRMLDVDGDGHSNMLSDGLLVLRYLFGFTGDSLTAGVVSPYGTRRDSHAIERYLRPYRQ